MYLFYSLALSLLFLTLLPYFVYQAVRYGKYAGSFLQRMGRLPESVRGGAGPAVWVHAVSVGEFIAARPLIAALRRELPGHRVVVSTTTMTGQRLALAERPENLDGVFYFPFDWAMTVRRALDHVRPAAVIILETEIWPNFLRECSRRGIPALIVNGRISSRSFARYRRVRPFIARVAQCVSLFVMQSAEDAERARQLGAPGASVRVCGNLKYDVAGSAVKAAPQDLERQFGFSSSPRLIVAGSTAPGEEEIVLDALRVIRSRAGLADARLVVAPRHPERFDEVAGLIEQSGFSCGRRSRPSPASKGADVILLDTIGELASAYEFASVVFVGGSLVPRGGHNVIEPAVYAKPIVVGPFTDNFRQVVADFSRGGALIQLAGADAFAEQVIRLLSDSRAAQQMGARAREILLKNRGATDCTVAAVRDLIYGAADESH